MNRDKNTIIICSNSYPPKFVGGAEIIAHSQAKELKKSGYNVVVFAGDTYSDKKQYKLYKEEFEGIEVYRIKLESENFANEFINFNNKFVDEAFNKIVDRYNPSVVHCHNIIGLSLGIIDIAHNKKMKTIITLHDNWGYCYKNTILKNKESICKNFNNCEECMQYITGNNVKVPIRMRQDYFKHILSKVDIFISPSKYLADNYIKAGFPKDKMNVIWNGIDIEKYENIEKKSSSKLRFTFVGYLGKHKGVITMLEALTYIKNKDVIQINIVGDGEERQTYIDFAKENNIFSNIKFWGKVPNSEIQKVYEETDVYFIASIWPENQPVSITEAFACKIPVIASNLGGNIELIEENKDGLLFEAGNARDLADKIQYFIDNRNLITSYGENAYEKINKISLSAQVNKIINKYNEELRNFVESDKMKVGFYGSYDLSNVCTNIGTNIEVYMLDWINKWDLYKLDIVVILPDYKISSTIIKKLMENGIILIVPEENYELKNLIINGNCGLYYVRKENIYEYVKYLQLNKQEKNVLSTNSKRYVSNL